MKTGFEMPKRAVIKFEFSQFVDLVNLGSVLTTLNIELTIIIRWSGYVVKMAFDGDTTDTICIYKNIIRIIKDNNTMVECRLRTWRRQMNHGLHQLLGELSIVHTAKIGLLRKAGYDVNPVKMNNRRGEVHSERGESIRWKTTSRPSVDCVVGIVHPCTDPYSRTALHRPLHALFRMIEYIISSMNIVLPVHSITPGQMKVSVTVNCRKFILVLLRMLLVLRKNNLPVYFCVPFNKFPRFTYNAGSIHGRAKRSI